MRRLDVVAVLALSCAISAGCGPTNSPVEVQGHALEPKSSLMFNILFPGLKGTMVAVSDQSDVCGAVETDACKRGSFVRTGTALTLMIPSIDTGEFTVGEGGDLLKASLSFAVLENGRATFEQDAKSGTITLEASELGKHASGKYDVTLEDGTRLQGTFAAEYCKRLEDYAFTAGASCQWIGAPTSCEGSCSCEQKQVKATCKRSDEMADWACTCTNATGVQSSCSMPASTNYMNACSEGSSCCPLEF